MRIERFEVAGLAQYSYVVSDGGEAVVIDPIRDVGRYAGLNIVAALETHIHADFASGAGALGVPLMLSGYDEGETYEYAMEHRALLDGDEVRVGACRLKAMHTPGHTPEHLAFLLYEGDGLQPVGMFSGDFLLVGSVGRPDLLGEESKLALARAMYGSVQRVSGLPGEMVIYPGHGAGSFCGAGIGGAAESTLEDERCGNVFFGLREGPFVEAILGSVPELPSYYPRMKKLNAAGAAELDLVVGEAGLSVDEVDRFEGVVVDLRGVEAFASGHVPGAVSLGVAGNLSLWAGWLLDAAESIVLVTADGGDDVEARLALARVGLDEVRGHLAGGMEAWAMAGKDVATTALLDTVEEGMFVLDVRNDAERARESIAGSVHVVLGELAGAMGSLPRDRGMVVVCESGYRAAVGASLLERAGFVGVGLMVGGMVEWGGRGQVRRG